MPRIGTGPPRLHRAACRRRAGVRWRGRLRCGRREGTPRAAARARRGRWPRHVRGRRARRRMLLGRPGCLQHVNGVTSAVSGYAGGAKDSAGYETVSSGGTGHAESVEITFDPRQITYGQLLQIYFSVVHDPTMLNRQGPDMARSIARRSSRQTTSKPRSPRPTSHSSSEARAVQGGDRHEDRTGQDFLPRRGLSPGLPDAESDAPLHRHQRPAEDR